LKSYLGALYMARMNFALTDDEVAALARLLRQAIDNDRFPLSPRLAPLKTILAELEPPAPQPEPLPPLPPAGAPPSHGRYRRRQ